MDGPERRGRAFRIAALALGLLAWPALAAAVELPGTWYVLVHYKDDNAANPDLERWDDRVWVFESKGRRLQWTEYPIVVFDDDSGRFERTHTGQYARILHHWEPDEGQRANIAGGLEVNSRGSKRKTLRGSDANGWSSGRRSTAGSVSVVTYQEVWSIDGMPDLPVFRRADFMGGGQTDTMEGLTEYATTAVKRGGDLLEGTFERDGTRHGTFQMLRAGDARSLGPGSSQQERQQQAFRRSVVQSPQIRAQAADDVKQGLDAVGIFLGAEELDRLAADTVLWSMDGVPAAEMQRRVVERVVSGPEELLPKGARPDPEARYRFPFDPTPPRPLLRDAGSAPHSTAGEALPAWAGESLAFGLPAGAAVRAAREGRVVRVLDASVGEGDAERRRIPNAVWVLHADGSAARYGPLADGIALRPGAELAAGAELGRVAAPADEESWLAFGVWHADAAGRPRAVDVRFEDGSQAGLRPAVGERYPVAPTPP